MKCLFNGVPLPALPAKILAYPHIWIYSITGPDGKYVPFTVYATEDAPKAFLDSDGTTEYWGYETKATGISATVYIDDSEWTVNNYTISACTPYGPGWTNTDAYHLDGALWVAASEPIPILAPVIEPLSMWMGWKAGNWVARQRGKKVEEEKTPIAYLYNGVRLPDINAVWTDEMKALYPYAYMYEVAGFGAYAIILASFEMYKDGKQIFAKTAGEAINAMYFPGAYDDWESDGIAQEVKENELMFDEEAEVQVFTAVSWTSHDILNADGTIYLAASEPVPVYE